MGKGTAAARAFNVARHSRKRPNAQRFAAQPASFSTSGEISARRW
jgi:hypothetical protein